MKILVSALESSSNLHLKEVLLHLAQETDHSNTHKTLEIIGIFDKQITQDFINKKTCSEYTQQNRVSTINIIANPSFDPKDFSVMGFSDVVRKLPFILYAQKTLIKLAQDADKILLMDSSSFHIPLARKIKQAAKHAGTKSPPIFYYILPQLWAWKAWRAKELERYCDKLLGILPFELTYYSEQARKSGQICYVGHPLLDEIEEDLLEHRARKLSSQQDNKPCLVFMPGSRKGEIERIFPIFYEVARALPNTHKILVVPTIFARENLESIYETSLATKGALRDFEVCFNTKKALKMADFGFICSGTATLEAALLGVPFVLGYKSAMFDYYIAKMFVKIRYIGLANIFYNALNNEPEGRGDSNMHIELLQQNLTKDKLLAAYHNANAQSFLDNAYKLRAYLKNGSALNVANIVRL